MKETIGNRVLQALEPYDLKQEVKGQYRCNRPGSPNHVRDSRGLSITIAEERKRGDIVRHLIRYSARKRNHHVANPEEINRILEGAQIVKD